MSRQGVRKREKRLKRLFGVSTIILSLLIAFIPNFVYAADNNGDDDGIHWDVSGNTLTISAVTTPASGTAGVMKDYEEGTAPWYGKNFRNVIVKDGVSKLGTYFLSGNVHLDSVAIGEQGGSGILKTIGTNTISNVSITDLVFYNGVNTLEAKAVTGSDFSSVTFPKNMGNIDISNFSTDGNATTYNIDIISGYSGTGAETYTNDLKNRILSSKSITNKGGDYLPTFNSRGGTPSPTPSDSTIDVYDRREQGSVSYSDIIKATVPNQSGKLYLIVGSTTANDLRQKMGNTKYDEIEFYDLNLIDESSNKVNGSCTITLPLLDSWDITNGLVTVYSVRNDKLETINCSTTPGTPNTVTFTTGHFSEFGVAYTEGSSSSSTTDNTTTNNTTTDNTGTNNTTTNNTTTNNTTTNNTGTNNTTTNNSSNNSSSNNSGSSNSNKKSSSKEEKSYTITVKDERTEKSDSRYISAKVTNLEENLVLVVKDSDGAEIQKSLVVPNKGIVKYVDLDLQNDKGEGVVGYGTCTVVLPIPQEMDLTKGSVKVMAFDANNALKEISSKIVEVSGKKCVRFNPPHFSEFALVYTPFSGNTTNGNGSGSGGGNTGNKAATGNKVIMPKTGGGDEIRYILSAFLFLFGTVQLITSVTKKVKTA